MVTGSRSGRAWFAAHAAVATLAVAISLVLVFTTGGHPPAIAFLPSVLVTWLAAHVVILGVQWLVAKSQRIATESGTMGRPWPPGIMLALVGTGIPALVGIFQLLMTVIEGRLYPYRDAGLWATMLAVWLAHGACFTGLLLRQPWSRFGGALLSAGWAALLAMQITEHWPASAASADAGFLVVFGLLLLVLLLGLHLAVSRKVKAFLTR